MPGQNKNIKLILNYVAGPLVFGILLYSIIQQVQEQADWKQSLRGALRTAMGEGKWKLLTAFLLMPVNWGIEARKWQLAMRDVARIPLSTAFKAVLSGTTFAFFTPNRIGEYFGRMLYIEEGKRISSIPLTIVCSIAQLVVTMAAGLTGLFFIRAAVDAGGAEEQVVMLISLLIYTTGAGLLVLTIFYFRLSWLVNLVEKVPRAGRWLRYIRALQRFNATILLRILSLSGVRYLVFIVQYYLLFGVFEVEIGWWQNFWAVSVVFLVVAIVPTVAVLTELGVRWEAGIEVVQVYSANTAGILAGSLAVWVINLVIPALAGSMLILGLKIFRR